MTSQKLNKKRRKTKKDFILKKAHKISQHITIKAPMNQTKLKKY